MENSNMGKLYICPTPIGNLEDITLRTLRILKEADVIACEDTRNSIKLLNHYDIKTPMTSYHEHNKIAKGHKLIEDILSGKNVALISDAGMPGISDPGEELIRFAYEAGVDVEVLPGPSACINALVTSGLSTGRFTFEAFLPKDKKKRALRLSSIAASTVTVVMYEAPHHLKTTLKELAEYLLPTRKISIIKELTKRHEQCIRTDIAGANAYYEENEPRGEYVLVIEGRSIAETIKEQQAVWEEMSIKDHVEMYMNKGLSKKDAMKSAAKDRGVSKREIYSALNIESVKETEEE